jgi:fucose 4-O-acetylase-like acetyltransferase
MKPFVIILLAASPIAVVSWLIYKAHQSWSKNPSAAWYHTGWRTGRVFGNFWWHLAASIFYLFVAVVIPTIALCKTSNPEEAVNWLFGEHTLPIVVLKVPRLIIGIVWVALLTFSLPLFIWFERMKFDDWVGRKSRLTRAKLKARFELNTQHMESFWKTVTGFYCQVFGIDYT